MKNIFPGLALLMSFIVWGCSSPSSIQITLYTQQIGASATAKMPTEIKELITPIALSGCEGEVTFISDATPVFLKRLDNPSIEEDIKFSELTLSSINIAKGVAANTDKINRVLEQYQGKTLNDLLGKNGKDFAADPLQRIDPANMKPLKRFKSVFVYSPEAEDGVDSVSCIEGVKYPVFRDISTLRSAMAEQICKEMENGVAKPEYAIIYNIPIERIKILEPLNVAIQCDSATGVNVEIPFTDLTSNPERIEKRSWDFGDGTVSNPEDATKSTVMHKYANTGTYKVSLTVTDALGNVYTLKAPKAVIVSKIDPCKGKRKVVKKTEGTGPCITNTTSRSEGCVTYITEYRGKCPPKACKQLTATQSGGGSIGVPYKIIVDEEYRKSLKIKAEGGTVKGETVTFDKPGKFKIELVATCNINETPEEQTASLEVEVSFSVDIAQLEVALNDVLDPKKARQAQADINRLLIDPNGFTVNGTKLGVWTKTAKPGFKILRVTGKNIEIQQ